MLLGVAFSVIHAEESFLIESDSAEVVRMLSTDAQNRSVLGTLFFFLE
jgi:hypothetical protein